MKLKQHSNVNVWNIDMYKYKFKMYKDCGLL